MAVTLTKFPNTVLFLIVIQLISTKLTSLALTNEFPIQVEVVPQVVLYGKYGTHYCELATVIISLWQFSLHDDKERSFRLNDCNHSLSIHFSFLNSNGIHANECMLIHRCLLGFLYNVKHSGIQIKTPSSLCFLKHLKSGIPFVCMTQAHVLMDMLAVRMARYTAYRKFSIQVKALPKLVLHRKCGTQRVVSRQNIGLGFTLCYTCPLSTVFCAIFSTQHLQQCFNL